MFQESLLGSKPSFVAFHVTHHGRLLLSAAGFASGIGNSKREALQSCKQSNCTLISSVAVSGGAQGRRSPTPRTALARAALLRAAGQTT